MALEGTHIKFALDLLQQGYFEVENQSEYLAGSVYPDSRYITKVNRELTHPVHLLKKDESFDDFTKGWHTHLIYDHISLQIHQELFPEILANKDGYDGWIWRSAIKIIEDIHTTSIFSIGPYLDFATYIHRPLHEKTADIVKYYSIMLKLYQNSEPITLEATTIMCRELGIEEAAVHDMNTAVTTLLQDPANNQKIASVRLEALKRIAT